jgi:hypothetical protein
VAVRESPFVRQVELVGCGPMKPSVRRAALAGTEDALLW